MLPLPQDTKRQDCAKPKRYQSDAERTKQIASLRHPSPATRLQLGWRITPMCSRNRIKARPHRLLVRLKIAAEVVVRLSICPNNFHRATDAEGIVNLRFAHV